MKKVFFVLAAMLMFGCDKETTATTATPDVVSDVDAVSGSDAGTDSVAFMVNILPELTDHLCVKGAPRLSVVE